jgi:hypothetical protein
MIFRQFIFDSMRQDPRVGPLYARVSRRPGWTWKYAGLAAVAVIVVPIILLVMAAVATFVLVFVLLSIIAAVINVFRSLLPGPRPGSHGTGSSGHTPPPQADGGRRNVRVIGAEFRPND